VELIDVAHEFGLGRQRGALRVSHFDTEFSAHALCVRDSRTKKEECEQSESASSSISELHDVCGRLRFHEESIAANGVKTA